MARRVMCGLYAVFDIFEDLVLRRVNESDASKFAELWGCAPCPHACSLRLARACM